MNSLEITLTKDYNNAGHRKEVHPHLIVASSEILIPSFRQTENRGKKKNPSSSPTIFQSPTFFPLAEQRGVFFFEQSA